MNVYMYLVQNLFLQNSHDDLFILLFSLIKTKFRLFYPPANYPFKTGGSYYRPNGWLIEQGNFCFLKIRSLLPTIVYM